MIHHHGRPSRRSVQTDAASDSTNRTANPTGSGRRANGAIGSSDGGAAAKYSVVMWTDQGSSPRSQAAVPRRYSVESEKGSAGREVREAHHATA